MADSPPVMASKPSATDTLQAASTPVRTRPSKAQRRLARQAGGLLLVVGAGLGAWQLHINQQLGHQRELLAEAAVLAQRMAWAGNLVLSEDQNALSSLRESKNRISLLISALQLGGRLDGRTHAPLMAPLQPLAQEINRSWQPLENASTSVLEGEPVALNDARFKAIRIGLDQAALSLEKLLSERRRNSPTDIHELTTMEELLFSLQAVSQVVSLTEPGARPLTTDIEADKITQTLGLSQTVIDRLMNGHRESNLKPASELERIRLLAVRNDLAAVIRSADSVSALLPKLSANIEASRLVGKHAEALRIQLMLSRRKLDDPFQTIRLLTMGIALVLGASLLRVGSMRRRNPEADNLQPARAGSGTDLTNTHGDSRPATSPSTEHATAQRAGSATPGTPSPSIADNATGSHAVSSPRASDPSATVTDHAHDVLDAEPARREDSEQGQAAIKGVIAALQQLAHNTGKAVEQSEQTLKSQAETLKANAQMVLQLAHAFHNISTETTEVARTALKSQQQLGEHQDAANLAIGHWEDVRNHLMKTASRLRRAGEISRELNQRIEQLPPQERAALTELLTQTRETLRDAVSGLAEGSVQINYGQRQAQEIAEVLGATQQQWVELLGRIEVCAGTASAHTQTALGVSRNLSRAAAPGVKLLKPGE